MAAFVRATWLPKNLRRNLCFKQGVDNRAFWGGVTCASGNGLRQDTFNPREIGDFRLHIFKMRLGNDLNLSAGLGSVIDQSEQPAYFFQREAKIAGPHNELQPSDMSIVIASISFCGAVRVRHDTDRLVVSDGFKIAAGGACQIDASKGFHASVIHFQ